MAERASADAAFCIVLHDVAPATWSCYADFVAEVEQLGDISLTLLVVPDYHGQGVFDRAPAFLSAMERHLERGDELVLHGYYHADPGPVPLSPGTWVRRRIYTHEGEFYSIGEDEAQRRLERGMALFARLGWPLHGFVPPAWLLGAEARAALSRCALSYTSDPRHLLRLPDFAPLFVPTLVWSARSAWRRSLSRRWNDYLLKRHATAPLLRLGLHPVDLRHRGVRRYWLETIGKLLSYRTPVTKSCWLGLCP
ncbi:MAG: DUF2334 domain-containing protein [Gammaproteobacteria bacterium]